MLGDRDGFEPGEATRLLTTTAKVPCGATGLNAAIYVHIERTLGDGPVQVHISSPGKFSNHQIERILNAVAGAINDALSDPPAVRAMQHGASLSTGPSLPNGGAGASLSGEGE